MACEDQVWIEGATDSASAAAQVTAHPGCGKTELSRAILAFFRGLPLERAAELGLSGVALACASSASAATNLKGGTTAHSLFGIPVAPEEPVLVCDISQERFALIQAADVIIWDEVFLMGRREVDALDVLCRKVMGRLDLPFGGKRVVLVGDLSSEGCTHPGGAASQRAGDLHTPTVSAVPAAHVTRRLGSR